MELLIGCGNRRDKLIRTLDRPDWTNLITLDIRPECNPDVKWNLDHLPLPFEADTFDEIHAYEVLEHCGRQGDATFFLAQFEDFWRILKPGGRFCATVPHHQGLWAWGDPGHTRVINQGSLVFLNQQEYHKQIGKTPMTDYRSQYSADFSLGWMQESNNPSQPFLFVLHAHKPIRTFNNDGDSQPNTTP